ncbi:MAG: Pyrimidine 5'-nucleotidase YjjG [Lentisphaerae bacterium ADurb.Bin242]|nr:MAG: Pyrimidine 5'-nucleotidase YjjG [Lentisphaerae bacterium ADurb.Bin242]
MKFQGLIFDINGTLVDILTNEYDDNTYRVLSNLLDYQGIALEPDEIRQFFFELNKRQRRESPEKYPEIDVVAIFREMVEIHASGFTRSLPREKQGMLPRMLAEVFRAASRFKLELYPDVETVLASLRPQYRMGAVSDGQSLWAFPELRAVGLAGFFETVIVSSDLGYRKPDARIFELALAKMGLSPSETLFIGNDMYRDVFGAHEFGMRTVFFQSNQGEQRSMGAEADYIIYHFRELPEAIRFLENQA